MAPAWFQIVVLAVIFTLCNAEHSYEEYKAPRPYNFKYSVEDPHTGDVKTQHESREGDVVSGSYSFIEADGSTRLVTYTADSHNGFKAVVHKKEGYHSSGHEKLFQPNH